MGYEVMIDLKQAIEEAEVIVIGGGEGLSLAAFGDSEERFGKYFADFKGQYGFSSMKAGITYPFASSAERWAYWSRYIFVNRYMNPYRPVLEKLLALVKDKAYFVITTTTEYVFQKAGFDNNRIFPWAGDLGLWQCSEPCHTKTYENYYQVKEMLLAQGFKFEDGDRLEIPLGGTVLDSYLRTTIPDDLIPRCPICDKPMSMHLKRSGNFLEDEAWQTASRRYEDFLARNRNKRTLFLEIGEGPEAVKIIKEPFEEMAKEWADASHITVAPGEILSNL